MGHQRVGFRPIDRRGQEVEQFQEHVVRCQKRSAEMTTPRHSPDVQSVSAQGEGNKVRGVYERHESRFGVP